MNEVRTKEQFVNELLSLLEIGYKNKFYTPDGIDIEIEDGFPSDIVLKMFNINMDEPDIRRCASCFPEVNIRYRKTSKGKIF